MKSLITGGAGFIGSYLSEALLKKGRKISVVDNLSTGRLENIQHLQEEPDFSFVEGDILDESLMESLIAVSRFFCGVGCSLQKPTRFIIYRQHS